MALKIDRSSKFGEDFCPNCCLPITNSSANHNCVEALRNGMETMRIRVEALESELRNEVVTYYRRERSMMLQIADLHEQLERKQLETIDTAMFINEVSLIRDCFVPTIQTCVRFSNFKHAASFCYVSF